jgi:hypothetical protein
MQSILSKAIAVINGNRPNKSGPGMAKMARHVVTSTWLIHGLMPKKKMTNEWKAEKMPQKK